MADNNLPTTSTASNPDHPRCYACKWRREIIGHAHSSCRHPSTEPIWAHPLAQAIEITGGIPPFEGGIAKGHYHGIRMGWFSWPVNFDPVWLIRREGFEESAPRSQEIEESQRR